MAEILEKKPQTIESEAFKERFEFRVTVGDNLICQRYFRISKFNKKSLNSVELADAIRYCASLIEKDLKDKTLTYMLYSEPRYFKSEEEMVNYFADENHKNEMHVGEGIVVGKNNQKTYVWGGNEKPVLINEFEKTTLANTITDENWLDYKFAFYDNEREVCSTMWSGKYPRAIRYSIDLSNKKGKCDDPEEIAKMPFDRYVLYKMVEGKKDIVWDIIKEICDVCGNNDDGWYTTSTKMGGTLYSNDPWAKDFKSVYERLNKYNESNR